MLRFSLIYLIIFVGFFVHSCRRIDRESKIEIPLNSTWELRETGTHTWFPAHVPGSVASDLLESQKNGKTPTDIPKNLFKANWEYRSSFDVGTNIIGQDVVQLCFKGLEPYTYVYLNDSLLLKSDNVFRSWVVNCKSLLKAEDNRLRIVIHHAKKMRKNHSMHYFNYNPQNQTEMTANHECPLCSPGIWKPVYLQAWSMAKIEDLGLQPDSITQRKAVYHANLSISSVEDQRVTLEFLVNNKSVLKPVNITLKKGSSVYHSVFTIEKPRLWWTNGLGNPYLYQITVRLKKDQKIIHELHQHLGVRTIEVVSQLNSPAKRYFFKLNGVPVFIKGASCVNSYKITRNNTPEYYKQLVESALRSNFNMIRVSDKGMYEDDIFYNLCDENGILVWQDFMVNPYRINKDSTYEQTFKQEAIEAITRLRNHPCMALWWGNDQPVTLRTYTDPVPARDTPVNHEQDRNPAYFQALLPALVKDYAYSVPYQRSLAFTDTKSIPGIDLFDGQMVGNIAMGYGAPAYGFPNPMQGFFKNDFPGKQQKPVTISCPGLVDTDVSEDSKSIATYVQNNFDEPKDLEARAYYSWLAQSELLKTAIENHRINMPRCMGTVFQQIIGPMGGLSLSTIDSSGTWKPAQYAVKDAFSHVLVVPVREKNLVKIYGVSDALKDLDAFLLVRLINFNGKDLYVKQIPVRIAANTSQVLLSISESELLRNTDKSKCCLVVQLNQATITLSQNMLYFTESRNLALPKSVIDLNINETVKGYNLILKSSVLMKNVFIRTVSKTCLLSDNNIDLLPGKRTKINVRYNGTKEELLKDIRIRSFADFK